MAHAEQRDFCKWVKRNHPEYFSGKIVVDVGSLDINGSNRHLFQSVFNPCCYVGIDIVEGKNVDIPGRAHEVLPTINFFIARRLRRSLRFFYDTDKVFTPQVMISTECLEHDEYWQETLKAMYDSLASGGLLLITAAGEGREEHGTTNHHAWCSPGTNDYYQNITTEMLSSVLPPRLFRTYYLGRNDKSKDTYFYGIKK